VGRQSDIKLGQLQRQLEDVETIMLGIMHSDQARRGSPAATLPRSRWRRPG
jgi:hypothetical protein